MKLRQTDTATRRLREIHPFSWRESLPTLKLLTPMVLFIWFCYVDIALVAEWKNWMAGKEAWLILPIVRRVVISCAVIGFGIGALVLILTRFSRPALETDQKGLLLRDRKNPRVRWKDLAQVTIEPVAKADELVKVVFHALSPHRRTAAPRPWPIVLERAHQLPDLIHELRLRHVEEPGFSVRELKEPLPALTRPIFQARWLYVYLFGMWLLLHGTPLLLVGLSKGSDTTRRTEARRPPEQFNRFVLEHFRSPQEFRRAIAFTGAGIDALGLIGLAVGWWGLKREAVSADVRRQAELKLAADLPGVAILPE